MENLKAAGMPDALLAKLKTLKPGNFTKKEEFLAALEKALGKEDLEKHQGVIAPRRRAAKQRRRARHARPTFAGTRREIDDRATDESYHAIRRSCWNGRNPTARGWRRASCRD